MSYLFKDTDLAAQRLQVLAGVFAESSRPFIQDAVSVAPQLAIDLGCGPGYTTHLLAETTHCAQAIGLDASEHFINQARNSATDSITFMRHDVTRLPFPTAQADLIFCRLLLTHLQDPLSVIERWITQLRPGGLLLLEEVDTIQTNHPVFRQYLTIVAAMLAHQGNQLYIGPFISQNQITGGVRLRMSRIFHLPVTTEQAATMFSMNIASWKDHPFIQEHYSVGVIDRLEADLLGLAATPVSESEITWSMLHIAYERI